MRPHHEPSIPRSAAPPSVRRRAADGTWHSGQRGQGFIEYGLILVLVAIVCVVSLVFFGDQLAWLLSLIASAV